MIQVELTANTRKTFGKCPNRVTRRAGLIPAVLYGPQLDKPLALELETRQFTKTLLSIHRKNAVINLDVVADGGSKETFHVVTREIQTDPVNESLIHVDFYRISLDQPMTFRVPVKYSGKAKGEEMGGDTSIFVNSVVLTGNALDIPDVIEVNITPLGCGEAIACQDLSIPAGVLLQGKPDKVCVSVSAAPAD
jgi:large subunit ribosomal protein L25